MLRCGLLSPARTTKPTNCPSSSRMRCSWSLSCSAAWCQAAEVSASQRLVSLSASTAVSSGTSSSSVGRSVITTRASHRPQPRPPCHATGPRGRSPRIDYRHTFGWRATGASKVDARQRLSGSVLRWLPCAAPSGTASSAVDRALLLGDPHRVDAILGGAHVEVDHPLADAWMPDDAVWPQPGRCVGGDDVGELLVLVTELRALGSSVPFGAGSAGRRSGTTSIRPAGGRLVAAASLAGRWPAVTSSSAASRSSLSRPVTAAPARDPDHRRPDRCHLRPRRRRRVAVGGRAWPG